MLTNIQSARALAARSLTAALFAAVTLGVVGLSGSPAFSEPKDIKWGTGPVGSSGHKALVVLADLLNKELKDDIRISVLPYPGAVGTVKSFATGDLDGYYGSDVALNELATDTERFKGFREKIKVQPVQSLWTYTLDVGVGIKDSDADTIKTWGDLAGKDVFTGPLPFDTRKQLENALKALGVKHIYKAVDLKTAGSQLASGRIKAMIVYAAGGETPTPWLSEASLAVDWVGLNPSDAEKAKLKAAKFSVMDVPATNFHKKDTSGKKITLVATYWGFDLGLSVSEDLMYKILKVVETNADTLAKLDPSFKQIAGGKMGAFQKAALESTSDMVPIHPGLAKFLKEKKMWNAAWDSHIAKAKI
jgi:TRAP transporter TAXI family solute receptor